MARPARLNRDVTDPRCKIGFRRDRTNDVCPIRDSRQQPNVSSLVSYSSDLDGGSAIRTSSPTVARITTDRGHWRALGLSALVALPDRVVSTFLVAAIPVGLGVIFHFFIPAIVLPVSVLLVAVLWRWMPSRYLGNHSAVAFWKPAESPVAPAVEQGRQQRALIGSALALGLMVVWLWLNRHHLSDYVVLSRDPGIYTLRGLWLVNHSTPLIDMSKEALDAGGQPGVQLSSLGFPNIGTTLYPQSGALLPGLLAVVGWFLDLRGVTVANLLIGGLALLAVYGFARRLMGPLWALLPMAVLAISMPLVAFSRGAYSEPVALVSTFGGLTMLWIGWQTGRHVHFFTAGLLTGVSSLARIDGGVTLIGVLAGFAVVTLAARSREIRLRAAVAGSAWALGAGALNALSLVDGKLNSPIYQSSEWHGIFPLLIASVLAYVLVVVVAFLPLTPLRRLLGVDSRRLSRWVFGISLVVGAVMISRPLWWTAKANTALSPALAAMQKGLGLPVDGTRTYSESSVNWLAMYLTWPVVVLAAIGSAMLLARSIRRRDPRLIGFVLTIGTVSALYLNQVAIFPDQIWAMRRFVPVVLPGLIIASVYPLTRLPKLFTMPNFTRLPAAVRSRWPGLVVAAVLGVAVVLGPVLVWKDSGLWKVANGQAQLGEMSIVCQAVGNHPVILAGPQPGSATFLPTLKAGCGSEVIVYPAPTSAGLATLRQRFIDPALGADIDEPVVIVFEPKSVTWQSGAPTPYLTSTLTAWEQPLQRIPIRAQTATRSVWIGTLTTTGMVVPVGTGPTIVNGP